MPLTENRQNIQKILVDICRNTVDLSWEMTELNTPLLGHPKMSFLVWLWTLGTADAGGAMTLLVILSPAIVLVR
jgi:hypothetical protein